MCETSDSNLTGTGSTPVTQAVISSAATSVTFTSANLNGNLTTVGVCPATTEKGFVYSVTAANADPLVGGTGVTKTTVSGTSTGTYSLALSSLPNGTGYSYKAYVYNGTTYTYGSVLTFTTLTPLANDECAGALILTVNAIAAAGTNVNATKSSPAGLTGTAYSTGTAKDVWFEFIPVFSGNHTITVVPASFDVALAAFTGGTCPDPTYTSQVDAGGSGVTESITVNNAVAGATYRILVWGYNSASGTFTIAVTATIPAPTATAATSIGSTGFTANWDAVPGATAYKIDIYTETAGANATDLFISEYVEGSGNNKYIEIFNGTGASVDLSNYRLGIGNNGGALSYSSMTGTLTNGSVIVYKNASAALTLPAGVTAINNGACIFNGNDAIALSKISPEGYVDIFGRIGSDPGSSWTSTSNSTVDKTLRRNSSVSGGVTINPSGTGSGAFTTLETEWTQYPIDNVADLGSHTFSGGTVQTFIVTGGDAASNSYSISSLSPGTEYKYRVRAVGSNSTSANSNVISVITGVAKETTEPGEWNAIVWSPTGKPTSKDEVTIKHTVTIGVDKTADCHNLTIGAGSLTIKSSSAGTGSLITTGTVSGSVTVERYLAKYDDPGDQMFHFISSPVAAQAIQTEFVSTPIADYTDFYSFSELTNEWINTRTSANTWNTNFETNFIVGKGYLVAYPDNVIKNFIGDLNSYPTGSPLVLASTNTAGKGGGWNLLGNPFPSAIDWNLVTLGDGMDDALYYYDNTAYNYRYYLPLLGESGSLDLGQRYIPAMQGFMVHAKTTGTKTVTLTNAARTHSGQNVFYKSTTTIPGSLSLKVAANGYDDQAFIHFNPGATSAFDGNYDAYKLRSYSDKVPMIFTKGSDDSELAINGLPELGGATIIPVFLEAATEGTHTLTANLDGLPNAVVYLEDTKLNLIQNLSNNPVYSFIASNGDNAGRFKLTFGSVGINNPEATDGAQVYAHDGVLYVETFAKEAALVNVYNLTGQLVMQGKTGGNTLSTFNASALGNGVYVVTVIFKQGVVSQKVVIRN